VKVIDGNPVKAQAVKGKTRTGNCAGQALPRKRRATPKQLTDTLKAAMDAGCTPRGAFLGADGSIKIDFGTDAAAPEGSDWDKMIDAAH
jgi:hypothetical protein